MSSLRKALNLPRRELEAVAPPLSYSVKPQATSALRVKSDEQTQWVLPWTQLHHGQHQIRGPLEIFTLHFSSHEVAIHGRHLGRLVEEAASFRVEEMHVAPGAYTETSPTDPFVEKIHVRAAGGGDKETDPHPTVVTFTKVSA